MKTIKKGDYVVACQKRHPKTLMPTPMEQFRHNNSIHTGIIESVSKKGTIKLASIIFHGDSIDEQARTYTDSYIFPIEFVMPYLEYNPDANKGIPSQQKDLYLWAKGKTPEPEWVINYKKLLTNQTL